MAETKEDSGIQRLGSAFLRAGKAMLNQKNPRDAAAISYFSLLALFPAILTLIALVDAFLGWIDLHGTVVQRIAALFPGSRQFLRTNLSELTTPSAALTFSCIII